MEQMIFSIICSEKLLEFIPPQHVFERAIVHYCRNVRPLSDAQINKVRERFTQALPANVRNARDMRTLASESYPSRLRL